MIHEKQIDASNSNIQRRPMPVQTENWANLDIDQK